MGAETSQVMGDPQKGGEMRTQVAPIGAGDPLVLERMGG